MLSAVAMLLGFVLGALAQASFDVLSLVDSIAERIAGAWAKFNAWRKG